MCVCVCVCVWERERERDRKREEEKEEGGRENSQAPTPQHITQYILQPLAEKNEWNSPLLKLNVILTLVSDLKEGFIMTSSLHGQRIFILNILLSIIECVCVCVCVCVFTMSRDLPCILFYLNSCSQIYVDLHHPFLAHCVCVGNRWREHFQVSCRTAGLLGSLKESAFLTCQFKLL